MRGLYWGGGGLIVRYPVTQDQRGVNGFDHRQYGFVLHAPGLATTTKHTSTHLQIQMVEDYYLVFSLHSDFKTFVIL